MTDLMSYDGSIECWSDWWVQWGLKSELQEPNTIRNQNIFTFWFWMVPFLNSLSTAKCSDFLGLVCFGLNMKHLLNTNSTQIRYNTTDYFFQSCNNHLGHVKSSGKFNFGYVCPVFVKPVVQWDLKRENTCSLCFYLWNTGLIMRFSNLLIQFCDPPPPLWDKNEKKVHSKESITVRFVFAFLILYC